jgi:uncharacterized membrane protein
MGTKKGGEIQFVWSKYKRLPLMFFLYITLCYISTPSSTSAVGTYTELLPPGWASAVSAEAYGINAKGEVIGNGRDGTVNKGFLYSKGVYTELLPPGWASASANGINDRGDVIGNGYQSAIRKGFLYRKGVYTELLPPGSANAVPYGFNDKGDVIGNGRDVPNLGFIATPFREK